jgi:hypothetical protein
VSSSFWHLATVIPASLYADNSLLTTGESSADTLVICPLEFQSALADWIKYRQHQGHSIVVRAPAASSAEIKAQIRRVAVAGNLKTVFLIGDVRSQRPVTASIVATNYVAAQVNVLFGSEPEIASDNPFADLDEDGIPELSIGRLPADTADDVQAFLKRVICYETDCLPDQQWQRKINFVAGVGGFGGLIDNLLEQTTKQIITDLVPPHYQTSMTFGSWRSPYCPDPRRFSETAIGRLNEGCLFWVYIGHGQPTQLDRIHLPDQSHVILDDETVEQVCCTSGSPIAIFLSCYTGAIDHCDDCLAENMIRQPQGPIGAICGTRVTMPYAMSLLALEMVNEFFDGEAISLGELMKVAKQRMVDTDHATRENHPPERPASQRDIFREMIQGMGELLSPNSNLLRAECVEHAQLIHLLGDPLLRLKRPHKIEITVTDQTDRFSSIHVCGIAPQAGELTIELCYRRDRFRVRPPRRKSYVSTDAEFRNYQDVYESSHDLTCYRQQLTVKPGAFELTFDVPADVSGDCLVRCMLQNGASFGLGSTSITIAQDRPVRSASLGLQKSLTKESQPTH